MLTQNWKITIASLLLFTFVALPAIGQEMNIASLKRLDLITWSSEVLLAEEEEEAVVAPVHEEPEEEPDIHSLSGESEHIEDEHPLIELLRNIFSSAMSF